MLNGKEKVVLEYSEEKIKELADKEFLEEKIRFCNDYRENFYAYHMKMMATIDYREKIRLQVLQNNESKEVIDFIVESIPKYFESDHSFYTSLFTEVASTFRMIESSVESRVKVLDKLIPELENRCDENQERLEYLDKEVKQLKRAAGIMVLEDEEKKRQRSKLVRIIKRKVTGFVMSSIGFISVYLILSNPIGLIGDNFISMMCGIVLCIGGLDYLFTDGKKRYGRKGRRRKK